MTFQGQTITMKKSGTWFWVLFSPDLSYSWPVCELLLNARHLYCSVAKPCPALCDCVDCSMPGFPVLHHLPELAQSHIHWISDAIQPSRPLSSPSPPVFPSIRIFPDESVLHIKWPNYWSFSFNISPSNEYSGLTSFRIDWSISICDKESPSLFSPTPTHSQLFSGLDCSINSHACNCFSQNLGSSFILLSLIYPSANLVGCTSKYYMYKASLFHYIQPGLRYQRLSLGFIVVTSKCLVRGK